MTTRFLAWLLLLAVIIWGSTGYFIYKIASSYRWLQQTSSISWSKAKNPPQPSYQATVVRQPTNVFSSLTKTDLDSTKQLANLIKSTLQAHDGTYGVYFEDLKTGNSFGFNEDQSFYAASLSKVPLLIGSFMALEKKELNPNTPLTYQEEDFEAGDGSIQNDPFGTTYTLEQILTKLCKESDNVAKNMLFRTVKSSHLRQVLDTASAQATDLKDNFSTPKDISSIFKLIYENRLTSAESGKKMRELLTNTATEDRLPEPLPKDIKVAHKIGTWPETNAYHDCGIIFTNKPYILCVMSEKAPYQEAVETIQEVSKTVYEGSLGNPNQPYFLQEPDRKVD